MPLKRRLVLAFVLLAVLPLAAAGIVLTRAGYSTAYTLKLAGQHQEARVTAAEVRAHVDELMRELLLTVRVKGMHDLPADEQRRLLAELLAWEPQFADLAWVDGGGIELAHVARTQVYGLRDLSTRAGLPEFEEPRASGQPWFGPIEIDRNTAEPLMAISVPSLEPRSGKLEGMLVARIRLKRMWDIVARTSSNDSQLLYITETGGLVVAHPNPSVVLAGTRIRLPEMDGINIGLGGESVLTARVPLLIGTREFIVLSEEPLAEALALPLSTALTTLLILAGALVAALALAFLAGETIVRPLNRLAQVAGEIAGGDLSRRAAADGRCDEIGELARAFNSMTARLVDSVETLEAKVDDRTRDLTAAQARLVEAIESVSEGFVLCDAADRVVLCNRRFHAFFPEIAHLVSPGRPFQDVLEAAARLGLARDVDADPERWLRRRLDLRFDEIPHIQHLSSGRWLLISERRTENGQIVAIYTDITDLKVGEEELRRAKALAESAAQAKSDFLAAMSHELRTPLNAVIGFSDTILSGIFGELDHPRYREYVQDIHRSGEHLLSLINDILDLSKVEAGAMVLDRQPIALEPVISRALSMMRDSATAHGLTLEASLPAHLPKLAGDERRLLQVLLNLLSNAVKFTPEGGRIEVTAHMEIDALAVTVKDSGIGIRREDIPVALEVFGQIDSSLSRRFPGSGLGLPLSRRLIEMHGGTLSLDSEPDQGTTVTVRLPLALPSSAHSA